MADDLPDRGVTRAIALWDGTDLKYLDWDTIEAIKDTLELIEDLRAALSSIGTDELDVNVEASVLPTGAATETTLAAIDTRLDAIRVTRGAVVQEVRVGTLASGTSWESVVNYSGKGVLKGLDLSTDYKVTQVRIQVDGEDMIVNQRDGALAHYPFPQVLHEAGGESSYFGEGVYDDINDYYSLFLKRETHFNSSLVVTVNQQSGADKNVACTVYYQGVS